jgi:hypothetical protein
MPGEPLGGLTADYQFKNEGDSLDCGKIRTDRDSTGIGWLSTRDPWMRSKAIPEGLVEIMATAPKVRWLPRRWRWSCPRPTMGRSR